MSLQICVLCQVALAGHVLWLDRARTELESIGDGDGIQRAKGHHDGFAAAGFVHRRELSYCSRDRIIEVADTLECVKDTPPLRTEIYYHFAPDVNVSLEAPLCTAIRNSSHSKLTFNLAPECNWSLVSGQEDPIQGWYSPRIGVKVPATVLVGDCDGGLPRELRTRIEVGSR